MKRIFFLILIFATVANSQPAFSEISSMPGAFSRMGFGARGIGMGNVLSSVKDGNLVAYYNPALASFQNEMSLQTSYSFLSLDRTLNFISFTRKFELGKIKTPDGEVKPRSVAGISAGIINAGVSNIDARDAQGIKTGDESTSENQFFLAVSNKFSDKLAIGIAFKFYYYKLFEEFTSTGLGFDIGALYSFNELLTLSLVVKDINSKYEWDSGKIYGQSGRQTKDKFPLLTKIGVSYKFIEPKIIAAVEFENTNAGTKYFRAGAEYNIYTDLYLRAGIDRVNVSNFDVPVKPSFGFSYFYFLNSFRIGIDYAFVIEPYSSSDQHIIGINVNF
ncbi:MAG: hypothetical protein RDU14_08305 [Melioribacteraceae bacterium]|nr:hypothetical protein [Melioribacteraceae bacterium]